MIYDKLHKQILLLFSSILWFLLSMLCVVTALVTKCVASYSQRRLGNAVFAATVAAKVALHY